MQAPQFQQPGVNSLVPGSQTQTGLVSQPGLPTQAPPQTQTGPVPSPTNGQSGATIKVLAPNQLNQQQPWYEGTVISINQACYVFLAEPTGYGNRTVIKQEEKEKEKQTWLVKNTKSDSVILKNYQEKEEWLIAQIQQCLEDIKAGENPAKENAQKRLTLLAGNSAEKLKDDADDAAAAIRAFIKQRSFMPVTDTSSVDLIHERQAAYNAFCKKLHQLFQSFRSFKVFIMWPDDKKKEQERLRKELEEAIKAAKLKEMNLDAFGGGNTKAKLHAGYNEETQEMEFALEYETDKELQICLDGIHEELDKRNLTEVKFSSDVDKNTKTQFCLAHGIACKYGNKPDPFCAFVKACNTLRVATNQTEKENKAKDAISEFAKLSGGRFSWEKHREQAIDLYLGGDTPHVQETLKDLLAHISKQNILDRDTKAFLKTVVTSQALGSRQAEVVAVASKILNGVELDEKEKTLIGVKSVAAPSITGLGGSTGTGTGT